MSLSRFRLAQPGRLMLVGVFMLALVGCASSVHQRLEHLPERVELNAVPFFRGESYQSAPGALASMLSQQGLGITPGLLEKPLHLPGAEKQLEQNIQVVAREYGMVVYPLDGDLRALLVQVAAGYPVMLRFTESSTFWSEPRYAVLVGYSADKQTVMLRAGAHRRLVVPFGKFSSAWKDAGQWAILIQTPTQLPAQVDSQRWLKAASELAQAGQQQAATKAARTLEAR